MYCIIYVVHAGVPVCDIVYCTEICSVLEYACLFGLTKVVERYWTSAKTLFETTVPSIS